MWRERKRKGIWEAEPLEGAESMMGAVSRGDQSWRAGKGRQAGAGLEKGGHGSQGNTRSNHAGTQASHPGDHPKYRLSVGQSPASYHSCNLHFLGLRGDCKDNAPLFSL